jgi:hypothetical protein
VRKDFKDGSLLNVAYTWSKSLTTYQADRSTGNVMPLQGHIRENYGAGIGDRRQIFTANFVWNLPWMKAQQGVIGHMLGGWQLSGIHTAQTGLPAIVSSSQLVDPTGAGCLGPSPCVFKAYQVGDPNSGASHSFENYFNAAAFINPTFVFTSPTTATVAQTTVPNQRPGALRLPGFWRTDFGVFKNLKFTESVMAQLRLEAFNAFNTDNIICCQAATPAFSMSSSLYNKVRAARDPRTLQLGMKVSF